MAEELVRMDNINKYYGRVHALRDVNLKVIRGEVVACSAITAPANRR